MIVATRLVETDLDPTAVAESVRSSSAGGEVSFVGSVRTPSHGHDVYALFYEAWEDVARRQLDAIATDAANRHGLIGAAVEHRIGKVAVGEPTVVVAASAAHRDAAFAGARELIDRVKAEVAIWKCEIRADGSYWLEGC